MFVNYFTSSGDPQNTVCTKKYGKKVLPGIWYN